MAFYDNNITLFENTTQSRTTEVTPTAPQRTRSTDKSGGGSSELKPTVTPASSGAASNLQILIPVLLVIALISCIDIFILAFALNCFIYFQQVGLIFFIVSHVTFINLHDCILAIFN